MSLFESSLSPALALVGRSVTRKLSNHTCNLFSQITSGVHLPNFLSALKTQRHFVGTLSSTLLNSNFKGQWKRRLPAGKTRLSLPASCPLLVVTSPAAPAPSPSSPCFSKLAAGAPPLRLFKASQLVTSHSPRPERHGGKTGIRSSVRSQRMKSIRSFNHKAALISNPLSVGKKIK